MRKRGFALLIVLWTLVPVSVLFLTLAGTARSDSRLSFNLRDAAKLQAAADGGINTALFGLLRSAGATAPLRLQIGDAAVGVRITSLGGLVNPNTATPELLRAVARRSGAEAAQATQVALAIVDWRTPGQTPQLNGAKSAQYRAAGRDYGPPGAPFESLGELRDVLGMTPALFEALRPNLSLYTDRPPDPALAPPLVRAALSDLGAVGRPGDGGNVFRITAEAAGGSGSRSVRAATVRFGPSAAGRPWTVLAWESVPES